MRDRTWPDASMPPRRTGRPVGGRHSPEKGSPVANGDGSLVTGRSGHHVYLIKNGRKRWVPDLWTMQTHGLSPERLQILSDEELGELPEDAPVNPSVPAPQLEEGLYVETETGV